MRLLTLPPLLKRTEPASERMPPTLGGRSGAEPKLPGGKSAGSRASFGMAAAGGRAGDGSKSRRKMPVRRRRPLPRGVRRLLLRGIPLLLLAGLIGGFVWTHRTLSPAGIALAAGEQLVASTALVGLSVQDIAVEGRDLTPAPTVLQAIGAARGTPILNFSPSRAKAALEQLPWVRAAVVERVLPGTVYVRLLERKPLAIWQDNGRMSLIDREGRVVTSEGLDRFPGLPLLVGDHAPDHAANLISALAAEPDLAKRVASAIWVGDRRWSLRLDNNIAIELPEGDIAGAWKQLATADRTSNLLGRDVQAVDLRFGDRMVVRMNGEWPKKPPGKGHAT